MNKRKHIVTIVKRSCITGKIVWVYRGKSHEAGRKMYQRVRKKENTRVRWWKNRVNKRTAAVKGFLKKLMDGLPKLGELTQDQIKAIREIQHIADNPPPCDTDFYNHIQRERKQRKRDKDIRQKMREREQQKLTTDGTDSTNKNKPSGYQEKK